MGRKLYVGNLPFSTADENLAEIFAQVGQVESAQVVVDRATGRSKGFGFVEMSTDEEAAEGISRLNGTDVGGRNISVSEARPRSENGGDRPRRSHGGGGRSFGGGRGGGGGFR